MIEQTSGHGITVQGRPKDLGSASDDEPNATVRPTEFTTTE